MLEEYRKHVEERVALGVVPQPLNAAQTSGLVELLKAPPKGEEEFLMELLSNRVPCLLYTSPSPRDKRQSRMPSSA